MSVRVMNIKEEFGFYRISDSLGRTGAGPSLEKAIESYSRSVGVQPTELVVELFAAIPKREDDHGPVAA
jgi:hypothetical protein